MTNYNFGGVHNAEYQDRCDEARTGLPRFGARLALLLFAAVQRTEAVHVMNAGDLSSDVWLRHAGSQKAVTGRRLEALRVGATDQFTGILQHRAIVPGTVTIVDTAQTVVDDSNGNLVDQATSTVVGTIDYDDGRIDFTFLAAVNLPCTASYTHEDYTDFLSPQQALPSTATGGGTALDFQLPFGRVAAGTLAFDDGVLTFVDDGNGNIIETTAANESNVGTIDYATGAVSISGVSANLQANITGTFNFNPFAQRIVGGGAAKLMSLFGNPIPELTSEPYADGVKGESFLGLVGAAAEAGNNPGLLITKWYHFGEDPYRVEEAFTSFPPGGAVAVAGNANA